jgi:hypothetical protein
MQNVKVTKLPLLVVIAVLSFCWQGGFAAEKEADDLEEALMVKLLEKRAKKRSSDDESDDKSKRVDKSDIKFAKTDDKSEISIVVVNDIKNIVKEPCLSFLASSELISWEELNNRLASAKRSLEMFEVKYKPQLTSGGKAPLAPQVAVMPNTMPSALPANRMAMIPGVATMPAVVVGAPGVPPKQADDDEEDEDETPVKPGMPQVMPGVGMPGLKPGAPVFNQQSFNQQPRPVQALQQFGAMPVVGQQARPAVAPVQQFGMPVQQPMGMPVGMPAAQQAPAPFAGGMPMAR